MIPWLFVYGTLRPGEERWSTLAPLLTSSGGWIGPLKVAGRLYATPLGWPVAVFEHDECAVVEGVVVELADPIHALRALDAIEGTESGLFRRRILLVAGRDCWTYEWPHAVEPEFVRINSWSGLVPND